MTTYNSELDNTIRDVADQFNIVRQNSPFLISLISDNGTRDNQKFEWNERNLTPKTFTVNGASTAGNTITFDSVTGLKVGDILRFENATTQKQVGDLQVLVTNINGLVVTGTRPFGGTTDATIPDNAIAHYVNTRGNDDDATNGDAKQGTTNYNYFQIFREFFALGKMATGTSTYDGSNELTNQEIFYSLDLARQMNNALIFGRRTVDAGEVGGTTGGMQQFITTSTALGSAITIPAINTQIETLQSYGAGNELALVCHPKQNAKISDSAGTSLQVTRDDRTTGQYINRVQTNLGPILNIVVDFNMPKDTIYIGDPTTVSIVTKKDDDIVSEPTTLPGSRKIGRVLQGQKGFEFRNADTMWVALTDLDV